MLRKLAFSLIFILTLFFPRLALASSEFLTSYNVNFDVDQTGETEVSQKIGLTNLTSRFFVSSFNLTIGSTTITDVSASTEKGVLTTQVDNKGNKTSITVILPQPVTGEGKAQNFTLKFKSHDFAQSLGKIWEVNLPKIPNSDDISSYDLTLSVPTSFGQVTSISPITSNQSSTSNKQIFVFNKGQLAGKGVSINFGINQVFDFGLKYHLENPSLFPAVTSLSLPPDTNYQDISVSKMNPAPDNVTTDPDGNYLAWYRLSPKSKLDVLISGMAKLYIRPKSGFSTQLSQNEVAALTKSDRFWESDNPALRQTLIEIFKNGQPKTNSEKAGLIYRYVVDSLKYDTSRLDSSNLERLGAVTALNNPSSAVCMEFTDLFIALSRAANLPARELDGFAYSQNKQLRPLSLSKDLLHAWPEYFDPDKGWVMVDPTWENTSGGVDYFNKFDLNHLVLAVHGVSSVSPGVTDQVEVKLSQIEFKGAPDLNIGLDLPSQIWAGLPTQAWVKVTNSGNEVALPVSLDLSAGKALIEGPMNLLIGPIPPFGNVSYQLSLKSPDLFSSYNEQFKIKVGSKVLSRKFLVESFFAFNKAPYLLGLFFLLIGGGYFIIFAAHIYRRRKPKVGN